ncbi:hypothetical protein FVE89_18230 [Methylobacterium sp. 2A]|nr:hypothetical protein [Methylobacterium sp. 2A]
MGDAATPAAFDIEAQRAQIQRAQEETNKFVAEQHKLIADAAKLAAEQLKMSAEAARRRSRRSGRRPGKRLRSQAGAKSSNPPEEIARSEMWAEAG